MSNTPVVPTKKGPKFRDPATVKKMISVRLPKWLVEMLDEAPDTKAQLIEDALTQYFEHQK